VEHFCVKFGDTSCIDIVWKTDKQTNGGKIAIYATAVGVVMRTVLLILESTRNNMRNTMHSLIGNFYNTFS